MRDRRVSLPVQGDATAPRMHDCIIPNDGVFGARGEHATFRSVDSIAFYEDIPGSVKIISVAHASDAIRTQA